MVPEQEIDAIVSAALAVHVPEREIRCLVDALCLVVARALDTAFFDTRGQAKIAAECQWLRDQWRNCALQWKASQEGWEAALAREQALLRKLNELGHDPDDAQLDAA